MAYTWRSFMLYELNIYYTKWEVFFQGFFLKCKALSSLLQMYLNFVQKFSVKVTSFRGASSDQEKSSPLATANLVTQPVHLFAIRGRGKSLFFQRLRWERDWATP